MASYATSLRKGVKWYRKLATELLLGISVVNSWVVYKSATKRKIQIRLFRMQLASYLLDIPLTVHSVPVSIKQHFHVKQSVRKNCTYCFERLSKTMDQKSAKNKAKKPCGYVILVRKNHRCAMSALQQFIKLNKYLYL